MLHLIDRLRDQGYGTIVVAEAQNVYSQWCSAGDPDQGRTALDVYRWECVGYQIDFIRPGKPMESGLIEGFNSRFRQECLNESCFLSVADAQQKIEVWRQHYNGNDRTAPLRT